MNYVEVADARRMTGLKLVLTAGVPGPWGESAKAAFHVKGIHYIPVKQRAGEDNPELVAWTGIRNAPIVVRDGAPPLERWSDIVLFAERMKPEPALLPADSAARALAFGLSNEICGEGGFGWSKRAIGVGRARDQENTFTRAYPASDAEVAGAPRRMADILRMLSERLHAQARAGSPYLIGNKLSMPDLHLACFLTLVDPLPPELSPMPDWLRKIHNSNPPEIDAAKDPILAKHRAFVYGEHLTLPLDF